MDSCLRTRRPHENRTGPGSISCRRAAVVKGTVFKGTVLKGAVFKGAVFKGRRREGIRGTFGRIASRPGANTMEHGQDLYPLRDR
ncbi:hypothetical protein NicSoilB8_12710 [Arthrobacter sp. NicSoilB8]|nr:hypothetical protein NicSoilB8_12710 [Arthrobacter sp. NicSoilB8]